MRTLETRVQKLEGSGTMGDPLVILIKVFGTEADRIVRINGPEAWTRTDSESLEDFRTRAIAEATLLAKRRGLSFDCIAEKGLQ